MCGDGGWRIEDGEPGAQAPWVRAGTGGELCADDQVWHEQVRNHNMIKYERGREALLNDRDARWD
jgi:hypothetical protein